MEGRWRARQERGTAQEGAGRGSRLGLIAHPQKTTRPRFAGFRAHWRWKEQLQEARAQPAVAPESWQTAHFIREPLLYSFCERSGVD